MLSAIRRELEKEKPFENIIVTLRADNKRLAELFVAGGAKVKTAENKAFADIFVEVDITFGINIESGEDNAIACDDAISNSSGVLAAVNMDNCRFFTDRCCGMGQAVWSAISSITGIMLAGKNVVIAGYERRGKDIAGTARAFGARVVITENNPVNAVEVAMNGFDVVTMDEAARYGDIFVVAAEDAHTIGEHAFVVMKDGAIICNASASDTAIDTEYLENVYIEKENRKADITEYELMNGRCINIIADGKNVSNILNNDGNNQLFENVSELDYAVLVLTVKELVQKYSGNGSIYGVSQQVSSVEAGLAAYQIDDIINKAREEVARRKLKILGCRI